MTSAEKIYDDNINTDMLFPGKYTYTGSTPKEIKPHLLEDLDPSFSKNIKEGGINIRRKKLWMWNLARTTRIRFKSRRY